MHLTDAPLGSREPQLQTNNPENCLGHTDFGRLPWTRSWGVCEWLAAAQSPYTDPRHWQLFLTWEWARYYRWHQCSRSPAGSVRAPPLPPTRHLPMPDSPVPVMRHGVNQPHPTKETWETEFSTCAMIKDCQEECGPWDYKPHKHIHSSGRRNSRKLSFFFG